MIVKRMIYNVSGVNSRIPLRIERQISGLYDRYQVENFFFEIRLPYKTFFAIIYALDFS